MRPADRWTAGVRRVARRPPSAQLVAFEASRKVLHAVLTVLGCVALLGYRKLSGQVLVVGLPLLVGLIALPAERLIFGWSARHAHLLPIRARELRGIGSTTWAIWGALLALAVAGPVIAMRGVIIVAVADAVASLTGTIFGTHRLPFNRQKTIEGLLAGTAAGVMIAYFLYADLPRAFLFGVLCGLVESSVHEPVDDNFACQLALALASLLAR